MKPKLMTSGLNRKEVLLPQIFLAPFLVFMIMLFELSIAATALAQERVVTGIITSTTDGQSLPGVNVVVKGTAFGSVSDSNGKYTVNLPENVNELVFSFTGFKTQTAEVNGKTVVHVSLETEITQLDEVVVTGVGVSTGIKKVPIEVSKLKSSEFVSGGYAALDQAIQGKISGSQVQLNSGEPGAPAYIQLRGINSLSLSQPIILLDGLQITTMAGLDMNSVDRIEIVKGAAGGMLYGAQGANGVIQIFSKRGRQDNKISVFVGSRYVNEKVIEGRIPLAASMHHFDTDDEGFIMSAQGGRIAPNPVTGTWTEPSATLSSTLKNDRPYQEQTFDHISQAYRTAHSQNTTVGISGGSDRIDYALNVSWLTQQSVRFGSFDRKNITLNLGAELFRNLTVRSITQLQLQTEDLMSDSRLTIVNSYPWVDFNATYDNGYKVILPMKVSGYNPLSQYDWRTKDSKGNRIIQSFNLNYSFPKFVTIDYRYGFQTWNTNLSDVIKNQKGYLEPPDAYWGPAPGTGWVKIQNDKSLYQNSLLSLLVDFDFQRDFNLALPISATTQFMYDWRKDEFFQFWGEATGFAYPPYSLNLGQNKTTGSNEKSFITYGYLINQSFNYGDIAGVSVGFRSDYSSAFGFNSSGSDIKPFSFPRLTAFFSPSSFINSDLLAHWKLRAAYGEAGIQPDPYSRQVVYAASSIGDAPALYTPVTASNPRLGVQRTKELELGTDLTLSPSISGSRFRKIDLTFSYWQRKSSDVIQTTMTPLSAGLNGVIDNLLALKSNGIDAGIDIDLINTQKIGWTLGIRAGTARTIVDEISSGRDVEYGLFLLRQNEPLGMFSGQIAIDNLAEKRPDGSDYIDESEIDSYSIVNTHYGPIVVNHEENTALLSDPDDKRIIGNPQPKFFGSFINDLVIMKKFKVNMQWDFALGHSIYNSYRQWLYRDRLAKDFDRTISINGESGAYVSVYSGLYNGGGPLSWFVEDGSYARLRNFSLSYDLAPFKSTRFITKLTLSITVRNFLTITKFTGMDPESVTTGVVPPEGNTYGTYGPIRGIDTVGFPNVKSFQFGIMVEL